MPARLRPPAFQHLSSQPLHAIVRDYPETLAVLRRLGIDAAAKGAETLGAVGSGGSELEAAIAAAMAWRGS
jgi:hypothetical protein